jgi:hypothetical protein
MWHVIISLYLDEKVVSFTRTLLFLIRPRIGNSAIFRAAALCSQEKEEKNKINIISKSNHNQMQNLPLFVFIKQELPNINSKSDV